MAKMPESANANSSDTASPKGDGAPSRPTQNPGDARPGEARAPEVRGSSAATAAGASSGGTPAAGAGERSGETLQPGSATTRRGRAISERKGQFLIAPRRALGMQPMGMQPLQFNLVEQTLRASPDIEIVDTVGPKNIVGALADGMGDVPSVLVAKMTSQKANTLHQQAQGRLIIERDHHLKLMDPVFQQPSLVSGLVPTGGPVFNAAFVVLGKDEMPLPEAEVYMFGSLLPANGITDAQGRVTLSLYGETPDSIHALYVKPKSDHWSFYQLHPELSADEPNVVCVRPLADWPALATFPKEQIFGWGQKAMRLDQLPSNYRGQGIKIAVIDSGAATTHDDLNKIRFGFDIINKKTNPNTWNEDSIAHGSHCAGVIVGADNALGVRGFAPDAEVHVCKLFPGGQISHLIDALEYCIEKQIDVVNLSLGGAEPSEALEQQILRAKRAGIACIVAAGNSGGPVQYPASSPNVLAVAAIGKLNEFPPDSYHTQTLTQFVDANGFFAAKFSCFGPQVAVCAPGVAITSSVPKNNYAVWDGTSMAAPHITGLAALVLAHHPEFQAAFRTRSAERVERLFQIIKASARRVNVGDPSRTGFGLPDVLVAVGLQTQAGVPMMHGFGVAPQIAMGGLLGSQLGGRAQPAAFGGAGLSPTAYAEQAQPQQLAQQWFGDLSGQLGQQPMGAQMMSGIEPFAAFMPPFYGQQQFGAGMQGYPFGLPPSAFGRAIW